MSNVIRAAAIASMITIAFGLAAKGQNLSSIPPDRRTAWRPGVGGLSGSGIPNRTASCTMQCATLTPLGAGLDDTARIQACIDDHTLCPDDSVLNLAAGTFTVSDGNFILLNRPLTLRGAGPAATIIQRTDGAHPDTEAPGLTPSPHIIVGPARWYDPTGDASVNLTADTIRSDNSVQLTSTAGFVAGQYVLLDELDGAGWQVDPAGRGLIWASPDFRIVWQRHNPAQPTDDPFPDAFSWFSRTSRPNAEVKQISMVSGPPFNSLSFTTPIHGTYRVSHTAQLYRYGTNVTPFTTNAGVENLKVSNADDGQIRFQWCADCWAKGIDSSVWHDDAFAVDSSFHVEIRDSYIHDGAWPQPGGAGYALSSSQGSSEELIENNIVLMANKVMVFRSSGAGSVVGYNYVDDGFINTDGTWQEVGLNASHMVGSQFVLFEGNYGFNFDSDKTHGNSVYLTVFRNHLRGVRKAFVNPHDGLTYDDQNQQATNGPLRCAGAGYYSYWFNFVGNVLGASGQMTGWAYENNQGLNGPHAIWMLGWDDFSPYPNDPQVAATAIRHGNWDYVNNAITWDPNITDHSASSSGYIPLGPPRFWPQSGYTWPWVDPAGTTKLYRLPAKARYDAGTPFTQAP